LIEIRKLLLFSGIVITKLNADWDEYKASIDTRSILPYDRPKLITIAIK
jgi:hypothetical protein